MKKVKALVPISMSPIGLFLFKLRNHTSIISFQSFYTLHLHPYNLPLCWALQEIHKEIKHHLCFKDLKPKQQQTQGNSKTTSDTVITVHKRDLI